MGEEEVTARGVWPIACRMVCVSERVGHPHLASVANVARVNSHARGAICVFYFGLNWKHGNG